MATDAKPWRIRPLYEIEKVAVQKRLTDSRVSFEFVELDLNGTIVRY
jgi:hypothetical protein